MMTLFDLSVYHIEPTPDPDRPTAAKALELISEAEKERDLAWLSHFEHFIFRKGPELWNEQNYQKVSKQREEAARNIAETMEVTVVSP